MKVAFEELFDPEFLSSLGHLSILARRVAAGGHFGEKLSKQLGSGIEFKDFRPYSYGDDLRSVDWNLYRRLGKVFLRLYEEQQDLPVYIMPDLSKSMFFSDASRAKTALKVAMAMAAISMNQNDTVSLMPYSEEVEVRLKSKSGKSNIMTFAHRLSELASGNKTDLSSALKTISSMKLRPGLLIIISDFFEPNGFSKIEKMLSRLKHKVLLIQISKESDINPTLQDELRLRDCETGETADIVISPDLLKRYREVYSEFCNDLAAMAKKRQAGLLNISVEKDVVTQFASLFEGGALVV